MIDTGLADRPFEIRLTDWHIRRDGQAAWRPASQRPVPGCWEDEGFPANDPGPYWYRTVAHIPDAWPSGQRLWLHFGAVSYDCTVLIDGREMGHHTGLWDSFEIDITGAVHPGEQAEIELRIEKPASLTAGPDSVPVPGRFPLRQTLAGFLPYVWGHAFGGPWQDITLFTSGPRRLAKVWVRGAASGQVAIEGLCSDQGPLRLAIDNPAGRQLADVTLEAGLRFEWVGRLPDPQPWSPACPTLYTLRLSLPDGGGQTFRFGLRSIETDQSHILLNGQPVYPRLVLSWGWLPDRRCPDPGPERVRERLQRLRDMGFNGVKLCLWLPPSYYFDLADELGMLLWLELPLWLPQPSPFFRDQTPPEYERLVRAAHNHPSVVIYSLGCELSRSLDASFLASLYAGAKSLTGDALVRDNSGSGEAYGGWLAESADYYDHHFYCDLQFLRPLVDAFAPGWRPPRPWLMGEFCDYDTVRDWPAILQARTTPWWAQSDPHANPQGARWEMRTAEHIERLRHTGLWDRLPELVTASHRQGLLHRKATLETVRARPELSGYVVTGEVDTPISTAGLWDDLGRQKMEAEAWRAFNDDLVLLPGWDRRRMWVAGGDRPARYDPYSYQAGSAVRTHLLASAFGLESGSMGQARGQPDPAHLSWRVRFSAGAADPLAEGSAEVVLAAGQITELAVAEFDAPPVDRPSRIELHAELETRSGHYSNCWPIWIYPREPWAGLAPFTLLDPGGILADLPAPPGLCRLVKPGSRLPRQRLLVTTTWNRAVDRFVAAGGRAVLLQQKNARPGPLPVVECPYWREALKLAEPHPAWGSFPHEGDPGLQFYALAPDCALDTSSLNGRLSPLLRRLDTRGLDILDYAAIISWGDGCLLATTLRLQGGLGDQPTGISRSPAAVHLLACWLNYLAAWSEE